MTPERLAEIHARAFPDGGIWSAADFASLLTDPSVELIQTESGFLLLRCVGDEAEILTLAVEPPVQRQGQGHILVNQAIKIAKGKHAATIFLEVDTKNSPARRLYENLGFKEVGRRKGYYRSTSGTPSDAHILRLKI